MNILEIKTFMKKKGITQIELSQKSNIPLQTLRKIFSGKTANPRIDTMQAIEKALGISPEPQSNEITEDRLQSLGFDLSAISDLSDEDLQLIRSTLKTLVTELKERKKK